MELSIFENITKEKFLSEIYPKREPVILRGINIGECIHKWTLEYLASHGGHQEVKVHVSSSCQMDFIRKNFLYRTLPFNDFVHRTFEEHHKHFFIDPTEKYYLRALGEDPRKDAADISVQFPQLAADLIVPKFYEDGKFFSSVFRIASKGVQLWTHYDVMDNLLIQIVGRKKVVLFHPRDVEYLYLNGDKSEILDVECPDLQRFPNFALATPYHGYLEPGDVLFIPALWFHNMTYTEAGVAVNVFWRHLEDKMYDNKDPYGNHDPLPAQRANQIVDRALKALEELPDQYRDFYAKRLCERIKSKACVQTL
ncbi:tRNA wybutosine-synthesizing protein 5-like [Physella acuta]|uniref:tRNA wybutosine-synthesizing protein 5-like n=1 Tax=Physella acuta TaxID=109671 RepID=UPI0027DBA2A1|nr:tRNA wybutosine-synthesizing protein 5-like [Physella acuta]